MRLKHLARVGLTLALWSLSLALWGDPGIAVIVARDAPPQLTLNRVTLRDIYLKKIYVDRAGHALVPVNLPPDHPLRRSFSETLLHWSSETLRDYWNERYFHGVRPPYVLDSQKAMIRFVSGTEGAIGYIADCALDDSVREVMRLPVPQREQASLETLCHDRDPRITGPGVAGHRH